MIWENEYEAQGQIYEVYTLVTSMEQCDGILDGMSKVITVLNVRYVLERSVMALEKNLEHPGKDILSSALIAWI